MAQCFINIVGLPCTTIKKQPKCLQFSFFVLQGHKGWVCVLCAWRVGDKHKLAQIGGGEVRKALFILGLALNSREDSLPTSPLILKLMAFIPELCESLHGSPSEMHTIIFRSVRDIKHSFWEVQRPKAEAKLCLASHKVDRAWQRLCSSPCKNNNHEC